jgi:hypothetical protein
VIRAALVVVALGALATCAFADSKKDHSALAQLDAAYQSTGKLAAGPQRTQQACTDAAQIKAAGDALPAKKPPAGSAVDADIWSRKIDGLGGALDYLTRACGSPDHKFMVIKAVITADQQAEIVDELVHEILDAAKPRAVPAGLKSFLATYAQMRPTGKQLCAQDTKLAKSLATLATPPSGADPTKWNDAYTKLSSNVDGLKGIVCGKAHVEEDEVSGTLEPMHDQYYALILALPPK